MQFKRYMFLLQYALFCNLILVDFVYTKAMVGHNIRDANLDEFPFVALLIRIFPEFVPERDIVCTATLISKNDVLTSDHCLEDEDIDSLEISFGSMIVGSSSKYYAAYWISFIQWANSKQKFVEFDSNDIAIIKLTQSVADGIKFASLSYKSSEDLKGIKVLIAGWGKINNGSFPTILQTARMKVLKKSECERKIIKLRGSLYKIAPNIICTVGKPYTFLQIGDSGGPVLYNNKIVAMNRGTCPHAQQLRNPGKVNIHIILQPYKDFLTDVMLTETGD